MKRIGLLHPGAMGAAIGNALLNAGHEVLWDSRGRSARVRRTSGALHRRRRRRSSPRGDRALDLPAATRPPRSRRPAAAFGGLYVDANAIAPATAARIAVPATTSTAASSAPPSARRGCTCAAPARTRSPRCSAGTAVDAHVLEGDPYSASALKMVYAAWTKGTAAMLLAIDAVAARPGVANELHAEWALSQPDLPGRLATAAAAAAAKGWRWAGEMREIARPSRPPAFRRASTRPRPAVYERKSA